MNPNIIPLENVLASVDFATGPLSGSPLVRPLRRLAEGLNTLVQQEHLLDVELDLQHPHCPFFLLNVALGEPKFYMELFTGEPFFDELYEDEEGTPLNILMNWMGSDTEPFFWQAGFFPAEPASLEVDFGGVLSRTLYMIEAGSQSVIK